MKKILINIKRLELRPPIEILFLKLRNLIDGIIIFLTLTSWNFYYLPSNQDFSVKSGLHISQKKNCQDSTIGSMSMVFRITLTSLPYIILAKRTKTTTLNADYISISENIKPPVREHHNCHFCYPSCWQYQYASSLINFK